MKQYKIGLQLYSVRNEMAADFEGTLRAVREMGYDNVEFAGYFGKSAEEIKALLKKYDLTCVTVHQGMDPFLENGNAIIDYMSDLGITYCTIPWYERAKLEVGTPVWDETVKNFKAYAAALREKGIKMLYHNHNYEFDIIDGKCIIDHLYETFDRDTLNPEFDTCWVHYAGYDPAEYIEKYADRVEVLHLKDFQCKRLAGGPAYALIDGDGKAQAQPSKEENNFKFMPLGMGRQDFKKILDAAEKSNAHTLIVEQDKSDDRPPLEAAKISRDYLRNTFGL